jgi:hypothetical protein
MNARHPRPKSFDRLATVITMVVVVLTICAVPAMAQNTFPANGNVGVGTVTPTYPVSVRSSMAVPGGGVSTAAEGNFNVAFASGNAFIGQSSVTGAVIFGQGAGGGNILFTVWNGATNTELMRITSAGQVGIGTANPAAALDVVGSVNVSGNIAAKYQDIAEWVPSEGDLPDGDVVVLSDDHPNQVEISRTAYDTKVAGVVSARPGMILGEASADKSKIATTGRVKVKVDATKHPVKIGDLLVTSDTPGFAMVSQPVKLSGIAIHRPGTIIGKALEPLASGRGEILVLLSMQ